MNVHRIVAAVAAASLVGSMAFAQRVLSRERTVHLGSHNYRRAVRRIDNRGVRLIRKRSNAPCVQGRSWGYSRREIWVSRGCEADFAYLPRR